MTTLSFARTQGRLKINLQRLQYPQRTFNSHLFVVLFALLISIATIKLRPGRLKAASHCLTGRFLLFKIGAQKKADMPKHILSVYYDESLLATRQMLLETDGYHVVSALGFIKAIAHCKSDGFDLFILGHSIPTSDKQELIKVFRQTCPAPILSFTRIDEELAEGDFHISSR